MKYLAIILVFTLTSCGEGGSGKPRPTTPPVEECVLSPEDKIEINTVTSHQVISHGPTNSFRFEVTFRDKPELHSVDCAKRQAHSFQFYLIRDTSTTPDRTNQPFVYNVIVRGSEFNKYDAIRLRDVDQWTREEPSWGPLMTDDGVDYIIDGNTIRFEVPWNVIGDPDGRIYYDFQSYNYGGIDINTNVDGVYVRP